MSVRVRFQRPVPLLPLVLALLAVGSLGASCGNEAGSSGAAPQAGAPSAAAAGDAPVRALAGVDTSSLTDSEVDRWSSLLGALSSPCGEPRSVGRCAQEGGGCRQCVPAARYLARLVASGFEREEIEGLYRSRYDAKGKVEINTSAAPLLGSPMAPVTIVEFSDFECPYCGRAAPMLEKLVKDRAGKVRFFFMNYPLSGHLHSGAAARAAVAAGLQGKFWEMHDQLFANQQRLEDADILKYAGQLGLDVARFERDWKSPEVQAAVDADRAQGEKLGVQGTPTIFVNGRRFEESPEALPAYIDEEIDG